MKIARQTASTLAFQGIALAGHLLTTVVLARYLGPGDNGRFAVLLTLLGVVYLIAGVGYPAAIVYFGALPRYSALRYRRELASTSFALAISIALVTGVSLILLIRIPWVTESIEALALSQELLWLALLTLGPYLILQFLRQILRAWGRLTDYNLLTGFVNVAVAVSTWAILATAKPGLVPAIVAQLVGLTLAAAWAWQRVSQAVASRVRPAYRPTWFRSLTGFGLRSYAGHLIQFLNYRLDILLLTALAGPVQAGCYVVATALTERLWDVGNSARVVLQPILTAADPDEAARLVTLAVRAVFTLDLVAAPILVLVGRPLVKAVFGDQYLLAAEALPYLVPGAVLLASGKLLMGFLAARGRPGIPSWLSAIGLLVGLPLHLVLIPRWGIVGAAAASSLSYAASTFGAMVAARSLYGIRWRDLWLLRSTDLAKWRETANAIREVSPEESCGR